MLPAQNAAFTHFCAAVSMLSLWQNGQHPSIIRATLPAGFECHDK
jgi:hypothetical protein